MSLTCFAFCHAAGKKIKLSYEDDVATAVNPQRGEEDSDGAAAGPASAPGQERRFRGQRIDTPSHPGER